MLRALRTGDSPRFVRRRVETSLPCRTFSTLNIRSRRRG
jgi:hypothetical protein